ncbi:amidohydrolase family protein [Chitinophaga nivalis]|uniref:Amidohydrolase family protein n=1 Tax=Chitinophaga nivalis TaxID=2991709 RepID=A0ABT3IEH1_9BACT|nr:amidohydrolase family protein [Chitinophaga nivalis]MCW3467954.1 amidohydrolase family protein [Chitinophaga nivalis]MCW3482355.1 amidohydrolase family protein [Chitinophaga nivalis]
MKRAFERPVLAQLSRRVAFAMGGHRSKLMLMALLMAGSAAYAQETYPVNGIASPREGCVAFTHATLVKDAQTTLNNATLVIRNGKVVDAGPNAAIPKDAVVVDCKGKYIYPSFVDLYSSYGLPDGKRSPFSWNAPPQFLSNTKGAYGWNQAIRSEVNAGALFNVDEKKAANIREAGFGTVLTQQEDGIARGTAALVTLADTKENLAIIREKAAAAYSFDKGSSTQNYPNSLMGSIALLRQTFLDAQWYKSQPAKEGVNLSLQAWNENLQLPQLFLTADKWDVLRADKVGDEFGVQFIIKGGGNEYQRIPEMAATKATFVLPVNFPGAIDVEDPTDARFVSLAEMKNWEMAPGQPAAFEKANIPFCLTAAGLKDIKQFLGNVRKAIEYGLTEQKALEALTKTPATALKAYDKVGSLEPGKLANFLITSGPLFREQTVVLQNWVQGNRYVIKEDGWNDIRGSYTLSITPGTTLNIDIKGTPSAPTLSVIQPDTLSGRIDVTDKLVTLSLPLSKKGRNNLRLSGLIGAGNWTGTGVDTAGNPVKWTAVFVKAIADKPAVVKEAAAITTGELYYPFNGYGWEKLPQQQDILIKNATVWTNEKEGRLENTDVLIKGGKIAQIGKNLAGGNARVIDGTGKHLSAGIIDEHSHIALSRGVNEASQAVTAEVRIADVLNPDDVNIYRQLSGGVTASHLLHGSANPIGGQSQLIKLRWGQNAEALKVTGWDPFIKFALGENVKQSNWGERNNVRFPQSRMGVEQVYVDAFTRARDYEKQGPGKRRDLELDALVEILHQQRFITCHSYVQSEINMLMHVADSFHFRVNTFTHILEGYKVADKMKAHGAGAGTFADWWAYKMEVQDAIPYNAAIMHNVGVVTAINSDDAEMARRLNQEAAKSVRYAGVSEDDALKMVTLNPAKLLHVDNRMGSIRVGKDADVVLWSDHPLSIYAKADKTIVDGIVEFDREYDLQLRKRIAAERSRLTQKLLGEKKKGTPTQKAAFTREEMYHCEDLQGGHQHDIVNK